MPTLFSGKEVGHHSRAGGSSSGRHVSTASRLDLSVWFGIQAWGTILEAREAISAGGPVLCLFHIDADCRLAELVDWTCLQEESV